MSGSIALGPLLGYETCPADTDLTYTVTVLCHPDEVTAAPSATFKWDNGQKQAVMVAIGQTQTGYQVWKASVSIAQTAVEQVIEYSVGDAAPFPNAYGQTSWRFRVPGKDQAPKLLFATCNGFSSGKLAASTPEPYALWQRLGQQDADAHLLVMGGDQLYCDEVFGQAFPSGDLDGLNIWKERNREKTRDYRPTNAEKAEIRRRYESYYFRGWSDFNPQTRKLRRDRTQKEYVRDKIDMANAFACIPTVMMWDDHDIFDGWGSYPADMVPPGGMLDTFFQAAREYFELLQLRGKDNRTRIAPVDAPHYSLCTRVGNLYLLLMDARSERTQTQLLGDQHWRQLIAALDQVATQAHGIPSRLLLITGVPVVYYRFKPAVERLAAEQSLEQLDDMLDHWTTHNHEGERLRLIHHLFRIASTQLKVTLLAGDVHVGALGVLKHDDQRTINQLVSSGIVHPSPTWWQWAVIQLASDDGEQRIDAEHVTESQLEPVGAGKPILRERNYLVLKPGTDGKLWATWRCEQTTNRAIEYGVA